MKKRKTKDVWDKEVAPETNHYFWNGKPEFIPSKEPSPKNGYFMVDLFCGCGGFSHGFQSAGFTPILGIDIHPQSLKTFQHNHVYASAIKGDMREVTADMLKQAVGGRHVSVLAAGVPCQGFSLCNRKRHEEDKRNFLFLEFIRSVKVLDPDFVVLENVSGLVSTANGSFKKAIISAIEACGYLADSRLLSALDYGVPQKRQRIFFIGVKNGYEIRWPAPTHGLGMEKPVMVWEAIGDLPPLDVAETKTEYNKAPFSEYQKIMRRGSEKLTGHQAPNHPAMVVKKILETKPGMPMYPKFKQRIRLHPDEPSPTQVSGGIRPQFQFGHPTQARGLSIRERCRIQSFPDNFEILGGIVQGRIQTGNAVPPMLANAIAKQIMGVLKGEKPGKNSLPKPPAQLELWSAKKVSMAKSSM